jgi:saccharopepsin
LTGSHFVQGTSLIVVPTDIAEMLNAQIGATKSWNGQYQIDCAKVPSLPSLSFTFGGKAYPLQGSDYILELQGTCISAFTGMDINLPGGSLWIIGVFPFYCVSSCLLITFTGDVFLRKYYTVYDLGRDAVGFALAK